MLLIDWIGEFFVSLPLRTSRAKVLGGVEVLKPVIAAERSVRQVDEQRDDGIRFSRSIEEDIPASRFADSPLRLRSAVSSIEDMGRDYSESFAQSLRALVRQRCGGKAPMAYKRAGLTRQSYSRIMSDRHARVEKLTVLRLCIGLQLNRADAEKLLASAGFGLSPSIPIDRIFIYCFEERIWNILDVCSIIAECGLRPFEVTF